MPPNSPLLVARQVTLTERTTGQRRNEENSGEIDQNCEDASQFCDPFFRMSFNIAVYLTKRRLGQSTKSFRHGEKMESLTRNMLLKNEMAFKTIAGRLNLTPNNLIASFDAVSKETFNDGCNFGRIVATYAFFIAILDYCLSHNMESKVEEIQVATARIITSQKEWVQKNGGWNGFLDFFTEPTEKFWKGFMVATFGLGALASLLYSRT